MGKGPSLKWIILNGLREVTSGVLQISPKTNPCVLFSLVILTQVCWECADEILLVLVRKYCLYRREFRCLERTG